MTESKKQFELYDFVISINGSIAEDIANLICDEITVDEVIDKLNEPCNMDYILLCSNWGKQTYRVLDVKDLSNKQVCNKVYDFYKHKTYRRLMGDHIWLEGWFQPIPDEPNVFKPVLYGS